MKVFCIKQGEWNNQLGIKYDRYPAYGDVLEVADSDQHGYIFNEYPEIFEGKYRSFYKPHFIPISDKEEQVSAEIQILELTK